MTVFHGAERRAGATAPARPAPDTGTVDPASLTVAELRALCHERGLDVPSKATKARLVDLLNG